MTTLMGAQVLEPLQQEIGKIRAAIRANPGPNVYLTTDPEFPAKLKAYSEQVAKPRIRKTWCGLWECGLPSAGPFDTYRGRSPGEAYQHWQASEGRESK